MSRKSRYLRRGCRDRDQKNQAGGKSLPLQEVMDRIIAKQHKRINAFTYIRKHT